MFNGNVGHQEILFTRRVFALFTFEWFVIGVGQLVIEQVLLVIADVLTELTFKPDTGEEKNSCYYIMLTSGVQFLRGTDSYTDILTSHLRAVATVLYVREKMHFESVALLEGFPTLKSKQCEHCKYPGLHFTKPLWTNTDCTDYFLSVLLRLFTDSSKLV